MRRCSALASSAPPTHLASRRERRRIMLRRRACCYCCCCSAACLPCQDRLRDLQLLLLNRGKGGACVSDGSSACNCSNGEQWPVRATAGPRPSPHHRTCPAPRMRVAGTCGVARVLACSRVTAGRCTGGARGAPGRRRGRSGAVRRQRWALRGLQAQALQPSPPVVHQHLTRGAGSAQGAAPALAARQVVAGSAQLADRVPDGCVRRCTAAITTRSCV